MRPTGRLHLGNLHGALRNWVELQESGNYRLFLLCGRLARDYQRIQFNGMH